MTIRIFSLLLILLLIHLIHQNDNKMFELEGGEGLQLPSGLFGEVKGPDHKDGGIDIPLPPGTVVFSKRLKGEDGKTMMERKKRRNRKLDKAKRALDQDPSDAINRNTYVRLVENLQEEEEMDVAKMNMAALADELTMMYGGKVKYKKGGSIPKGKDGQTKRSWRKGKKMAVYMGGEWHHFGDSSMEDYRTHKSKKRKKAYYDRHAKNMKGDSARAKAFRIYSRKTWEKGGEINEENMLPEATVKPVKFDRDAHLEYAARYLDRFKGKHAFTPEDVVGPIEEYYAETGYQFPIDLVLTQMQAEGAFRKDGGRSKYTNPVNWGENDSGTKLRFESPQESIKSYIKGMHKNYLADKNVDELLDNFVNVRGKRYASNPHYEDMLGSILGKVRKYGKNIDLTEKQPSVREQFASYREQWLQDNKEEMKRDTRKMTNGGVPYANADPYDPFDPGLGLPVQALYPVARTQPLPSLAQPTNIAQFGQPNVNILGPGQRGGGIDLSGILAGLPGLGPASVVTGMIAPFALNLMNRAGDRPNRNFYANYGDQAMRTFDRAGQGLGATRDMQYRQNALSAQTARRTAQNNARSVNVTNALNQATQTRQSMADDQATTGYYNQLRQLMSDRARMQQDIDRVRMRGEEQSTIRDTQDRDNYFSNMSGAFANLSTQGQHLAKMNRRQKMIEKADEAALLAELLNGLI
jgi:hypothetical protein